MVSAERLLICLRFGIGDLVMELPALRMLRRQRPDDHFTVLGARPAIELLEGDPDFDAVVCVQDFGFVHWGDHGTPEAKERLHDWLDAGAFDRILDASHAIAGVRDALIRTGLPVQNTGDHFHRLSAAPGQGARSIAYDAVHAWGLQPGAGMDVPHLHIPPPAQEAALASFLRLGLWDATVVAISPAASSPLKRWPLAQLSQVVRWLTDRRECRVMVFGVAASERHVLQILHDAAPDALTVINPAHLQYTAALLARCTAFLGNDTGLTHIAAAIGTPTAALFGPTSRDIYLPAGATAVGVEHPCPHRPVARFGPPDCVRQERCLVRHESCISAVTVEAVTATLAKLLPRTTTSIHQIPEENRS